MKLTSTCSVFQADSEYHTILSQTHSYSREKRPTNRKQNDQNGTIAKAYSGPFRAAKVFFLAVLGKILEVFVLEYDFGL